MPSRLTAAAALTLLLAAPQLGTVAEAAELKVMASGAMAHALNEIATDFAKRNGDMLSFTTGTTGALSGKLRGGEPVDVIEVTSAGMDALEKDKLVVAGTRVELARALLGAAVSVGAPAPAIATEADLKRTLLAAKKVAYIDPKVGGQAGAAIMSMLRKLGIEDAVVKKSVYGKTGADAVNHMVHGDAEIAISFTSEILPIAGAKSVGLLPASLQNPSSYAAAIAVKSENKDTARALLAAMKTPEAQAIMVKAGLEPVAN
jgi:molybdate transport system substrate-binding protein